MNKTAELTLHLISKKSVQSMGSTSQLAIGMLFILFGIFIGGVGLVSAGIGIGIPMIPIGIYLVIRGIRDIVHDKTQKEKGLNRKQKRFESTNIGKFLFGVLIIIVGIAISTIIIGIPIIFVGILLIFFSFKK